MTAISLSNNSVDLLNILAQKKKETARLETVTKNYPDAKLLLIHGMRVFVSQKVETLPKFENQVFFSPEDKSFFLRKKTTLRPRNQESIDIYSSEFRRLSSAEVQEILQTAFNSPFTVDKTMKKLFTVTTK